MSIRLNRREDPLNAFEAAMALVDQAGAALKQLEGVTLTPLTLRHLRYIAARPDRSNPDRARDMGCFPNSAAYVTDVLLKQGLIEPTKVRGSKIDRFRLSPRGMRILEVTRAALMPLARKAS